MAGDGADVLGSIDGGDGQRLIHAKLIALLRLVRASGDLAYPRGLDLSAIHRRLLSLIGLYEALTSMELVALTGLEKAQVSRAVSGMHALGLIDRPSLRGRITLSPVGAAMLERLLAIAEGRNEALLTGIPPDARQRFTGLTLRLVRHAAATLRNERQLDGAGAPAELPPMPSYIREAESEITLLLPALVALISYMQRSGTLLYKREIGISGFDWQMLAQLAQQDPQTLAQLVQATGRDKSQVGRAVQRLVDTGLVTRHKVEGRRDILLGMTSRGRAAHRLIREGAVRRDDALFEDVTPEQRAEYHAMVDRLMANAARLIQDESAREPA